MFQLGVIKIFPVSTSVNNFNNTEVTVKYVQYFLECFHFIKYFILKIGYNVQ